MVDLSIGDCVKIIFQLGYLYLCEGLYIVVFGYTEFLIISNFDCKIFPLQ